MKNLRLAPTLCCCGLLVLSTTVFHHTESSVEIPLHPQPTDSINLPNNNETVTTSKPVRTSERISKVKFNDMRDLITYADNIVIGKVSAIEENYGRIKYVIRVIENLKGTTDREIDLYASNEEYHENDELLLLLSFFDSAYYKRPVYTVVTHDSALVLSNGVGIGKERYGNGKTIEELKSAIEQEEKGSAFHSVDVRPIIIDKPKDSKELLALSDYVTRIIPTKIVFQNDRVKVVEFHIVDQLKGSLAENTLTLPASVALDNEYIVCTKKLDDSSLTLATREGSVIPADDESAADFLEP